MKLNGNLVLNTDASSEIQNAYIERLASAPTFNAAQKGRLYFNTTSSLYFYNNGTAWSPFSTGGDAALVQAELDALETSLGSLINADGTYSAAALTGTLAGSTSLTNVLQTLQTLNATVADDLADAVAAINADIAAEEAARIAADGTHTTDIADLRSDLTDEIARATAAEGEIADDLTAEIARATAAESAEVTNRTNADNTLQSNIDLKVAKAGDSMTGNLAFGGTSKVTGLATPTAAGDAANKAYVDNLVAGITWEAPVDGMVLDKTLDLPVAPAEGSRYFAVEDDAVTINKIFTYTGGAYDAGVAVVEGAAFYDKGTDKAYVFNGTAMVQFSGGEVVNAGVGLLKTGSTIDVNLGAGIAQLPTDEVGVDVLGTGGLFLTVNGTDPSTLTGAQLAVKLDGTTISRGSNGIKVADSVITSISDVASDLADEVTRATTAEGVIAGDLADEVTRATTAEGVIAGTVTALDAKVEAMYFLYSAGSASTSHTVTHNLGQKYCNVTIVDDTDNVVIPQSVVYNTTTQLTVTFTSALQCKVIVMGLA